MMRLAPLMLLPLLAACATQPSQDACPGDFTLTNQSSRPVEQLYAGSDRDLLDPSVLPPGQTARLRAQQPLNTRLRLVFDDGRAVELGPVNLCSLPRVVVGPGGIQANPGGR